MTSEFQLGDRVTVRTTDIRFRIEGSKTKEMEFVEATIVLKDGDIFLVNNFSRDDFYGNYSYKYGRCMWFHKRRFTPVSKDYDPIQDGDTDEDV